jgi:L-fuconolactonase
MSTATAGARVSNDFLPVRSDWLNLHEEEVIEPELPIIDPHHHLWERPGARYLLPELLEDTGSGHNIVATVFVECRAMYRAGASQAERPLGETEFVNGVAAMSASGLYGATRACAGIVGHADLTLGAAVRPVLEAHKRIAGDRFRGIRHVAAWHASGIKATSFSPPPNLLLDAKFREGLGELAPLGLSFDAWLLHTQISQFADLAQRHPETAMILDHVGGPIGIGPYVGRRDEVFAEWSAAIRELARCSNVHVKLGGLGMHTFGFDFHARERPPSSQELAAAWKPYIETCIEAFGPSRAMFESNFPVDKGSCSYQALWNAFKRITSAYAVEEKVALYGGTAARLYRLEHTARQP